MYRHDPSYTGEIHPIPSALGSEALAGPASTTVRENVGSPDEDCFMHFFDLLFGLIPSHRQKRNEDEIYSSPYLNIYIIANLSTNYTLQICVIKHSMATKTLTVL